VAAAGAAGVGPEDVAGGVASCAPPQAKITRSESMTFTGFEVVAAPP
jgi:hypothetical protein